MWVVNETHSTVCAAPVSNTPRIPKYPNRDVEKELWLISCNIHSIAILYDTISPLIASESSPVLCEAAGGIIVYSSGC